MEKTCNFCGSTEYKEVLVQYVHRRDGKFLIVNDVPCEQCSTCKEQYFHADVIKRIEREFKAIHSEGRPAPSSVSVPLEEFSRLAA